ncbi:hypothetical protein Pst134EB_020362 [Puccinia striiformis f. sp. tritici]|nr:hypothetical protein Pst134EB_020362 [Puccinia striiformis f. sp. tritici]
MSAFNSSVAGPTPRGRQAKATKGHNMLTAGLRRLRTLSGVYHGRSSSDLTDQQRPPVPVLNRASFDQNQDPWPAATLGSPFTESAQSSGPLPPSLSQLNGIHFVPDANQDPDLDQASSTNPSRPQSAESAPSSGAAPLGNIINSASDVNPSFAGSWSEPRDDDCGSSPSTLSAFEDSSIASDDTSSAIGALLPSVCPVTGAIQLSAQACQAAYPPIDLESPYAPYAPTSPLSATSVQKPNQSTTTSVGTFNVRMGLRHLPSIVPKATTKLHLQSHQTTQHQQPGSSPSSTVDIHLEKTGSSINTCPSSPCEVRNASTLGCSVYVSGSDQSSPITPESLQYKEGATTPRTGGIKTKLGWSGKKNHRHTQSASIGHTGSIPFPCSTQDDPEMTPKQQRERNCSEGAKSMLRSNLWVLPIQRIRTSSDAISTIIRGIRSRKTTLRHSPSETSFEARPFSVRTESFYEILDTSAIPCDSTFEPR